MIIRLTHEDIAAGDTADGYRHPVALAVAHAAERGGHNVLSVGFGLNRQFLETPSVPDIDILVMNPDGAGAALQCTTTLPDAVAFLENAPEPATFELGGLDGMPPQGLPALAEPAPATRNN